MYLLKTFKINLNGTELIAKRIIFIVLRSIVRSYFIKIVAKLDYFANFGHIEPK